MIICNVNMSNFLGVVGSKTVRNTTTVTLQTATERWYETEKSKIIQEDLDTLILLVEQLEINLDNVENEDNTFKTRYENQVEINAQYEKTIEEMTRLRNKMKEGTDPYKGMNNAELQKTVIDLQRRRTAMESQLKDLEWRLDQESKAYYKADEKCKQLHKDAGRKVTKILDEHLRQIDKERDRKLKALARGPPKNFSPRQLAKPANKPSDSKSEKREEVHEPQSNTRNSPAKSKKPSSFGTKKTTLSSTVGNREDSATSDTMTDVKSPGTKRKSFQKRLSNIANSQSSDSESKTPTEEPTNVNFNKRVLHPKRGPIKKTAATRHLPKIDR